MAPGEVKEVTEPNSGLVTDLDSDIIEQVRAGDTRRFALLVDRHKDRALTLALRLTGNRGEAEELVQDAFLKAYQNLDGFRGEAKFGTWFYRILYNLCMTKVIRRKGKPEAITLEEGNVADVAAIEQEELSIVDRMEEDEVRGIVTTEIDLLPEKYKTVVTLFYLQDMSYEEIAGVVQAPIGTVKTNLFRARAQLKNRVLGRLKGEVKVA